jgi:RNA polymerase sigma-70 factor, ECF subfamily
VAASILNLAGDEPVGASAGDFDLAAALREGSEEAYELLISQYQQPVYNLAFRLLNDPTDACDVVQEVFLKVFRKIGDFRGQSSLRTWVYRITVNEAHNQMRWFFRHRRREVGLEEESPEGNPAGVMQDSGRSPFEQVFDHERRDLIEQALARINPSFREAVVLRDVNGLSYEEIAEILQLSLGTVKSRILRGREALRHELEDRLVPVFDWAPKTGLSV